MPNGRGQLNTDEAIEYIGYTGNKFNFLRSYAYGRDPIIVSTPISGDRYFDIEDLDAFMDSKKTKTRRQHLSRAF